MNLRLRNISHSIVNQLVVIFSDSTSPVLEEALASNTLAEDDAAELEHFLYDRPSFVWSKPSSDVSILPDETEDLSVEVHGKRGLTHGSILVEYAHVHGGTQNLGVHARRVEISLAVTVNASLDLVTCDFVPYTSNIESVTPGSITNRNKFFLVLELRNSWIGPLDMQLSITGSKGHSNLISHSFHSGQTRRIVLPLPRICLSSTIVESPIPRKRKDRQFVLPSANSINSITLAREAWWHRQHILANLQGRWMEPGNDRTGDVELRGIRLNERHVRVVRCEAMEASINAVALDEQQLCHQLSVKVQNNQGSPHKVYTNR
jgi:hypothetical protein